MAARKLTDKFCASVKAVAGSQVAYPDTDVRGLEFRVSGDGRKTWSLRYRAEDGVQRRMSLGVYPSTELADARTAAKKVIGAVADGKDPAADKRRQKREAKAEPVKTMDDLADAYFRACRIGEWKPKGKVKRDRTLSDEQDIYDRYLKPDLGKMRVDDITRVSVKAAIRKLVERGINARANRAQAVARQMFAFAIAEDRVTVNPATGFQPLGAEAPRVRVLSDAELAKFWKALQDPGALKIPQKEGDPISVTVGRPMAILIELCLLLLQRRTEIAGMRRDELNLEQGTWLISAERMKGGVAHMVPLPARAVALISEAITIADRQQDFRESPVKKRMGAQYEAPPRPACVFPSRADFNKPVGLDSPNHAMRQICAALGIVDATPHDLRRTGSTYLTSERLGISPFVRSKVLGHRGDAGGGAAVSMIHYDANTYLGEKRRALEGWEALVLDIAGARSRSDRVRTLAEYRV